MPLTAKGEKILAAFEREYGAEKGKSYFYAAKNKGTISGVDACTTDCDITDEEAEIMALDAIAEMFKGASDARKKGYDSIADSGFRKARAIQDAVRKLIQ